MDLGDRRLQSQRPLPPGCAGRGGVKERFFAVPPPRPRDEVERRRFLRRLDPSQLAETHAEVHRDNTTAQPRPGIRNRHKSDRLPEVHKNGPALSTPHGFWRRTEIDSRPNQLTVSSELRRSSMSDRRSSVFRSASGFLRPSRRRRRSRNRPKQPLNR
jgi:hypothetical protein